MKEKEMKIEIDKEAIRKYVKKHINREISTVLTKTEIEECIDNAIEDGSVITPMDVVFYLRAQVQDNLCEMCGICCREESPIYILDEEIAHYSKYFGMSFPKHIQQTDGKWYLKNTKPCEFLTKDNKCSIYEHRPIICRAFPFNNLDNLKDGRFGITLKPECKIPRNMIKRKTLGYISTKAVQKTKPELDKRIRDHFDGFAKRIENLSVKEQMEEYDTFLSEINSWSITPRSNRKKEVDKGE